VAKLFVISEDVCEERNALRGLRYENAKYHVPASSPSKILANSSRVGPRVST
jgi:hypothetical protein